MNFDRSAVATGGLLSWPLGWRVKTFGERKYTGESPSGLPTSASPTSSFTKSYVSNIPRESSERAHLSLSFLNSELVLSVERMINSG